MARGGKIGYKHQTRSKDKLRKVGSDESDEDYKVNDDEEIDESEDDYCSSLDESQESFEKLQEEEWAEKKVKKVGRPREGKGFRGRKKNGVLKPKKKNNCTDYLSKAKRKRSNVARKQEKDDYAEFLYSDEDEEFIDEKPRKKSRFMKPEKYGSSCNDKVTYLEEREDCHYNYDDGTDNEDDEEFTPSDDWEMTVSEPVKKRVVRRKNRSTSVKQPGDERTTAVKKKIAGRRCGRTSSNVNSDSDFVSSGSSDYEYTISEEEREQIREANEICGGLTTSLRSSNFLEMIKEEEVFPSPSKRKLPGKKGKQKVVDMKIEVGKQVCGICLSEEGKRTVRGVLNSCSHYFCFACIMEWSKVESRCPLCKQRFGTISRTAHDVRDAVFPVPELDQVYQPSEEELRGYLDPYENVLCTECQQGGDDALMLLCDLCDSPAHTYCVGLGREVPDGSWYCDGCRPTALASSNPQNLNLAPDLGASNYLSVGSSPATTIREFFDLNEAYVPDTPLSQLNRQSQSPGNSTPQIQATSPASGSGVLTVFERRRIQRQIHQLLNNRSRQIERSDSVAPVSWIPRSGINLFGSLITRDGLSSMPSTAGSTRTAPQHVSMETFPPRFDSTSGVAPFGLSSTSNFPNDLAGVNGRIGAVSGPFSGNSNPGANSTTFPYLFREPRVPSRTSPRTCGNPILTAAELNRRNS